MGVKNQSNEVLQAEEQDKLTYVLDVIHNRFRYISNITELEKIPEYVVKNLHDFSVNI